MRGIYVAPSIFDGKVYIGSDVFYCLDADNGGEIWNYATGDYITSSAAVAYDNVYFTDYSTGVYCLDADNGSKIWNCEGVGKAFSSCPAVADYKVYVGTLETGKLLCLNAITGANIWEYKTNPKWYLFGSPAVADGRVYFGGGENDNLYYFEDTSKPPSDPVIKGRRKGLIGSEYGFYVVSRDPEEDVVKYYVDWGDGNTTGWTGFYPSSKQVKVSHTWSNIGSYKIRVMAQDEYNIKSHWSERIIEIIDAPALDIQAIGSGLFKINTVIKNIGAKDAVINWSIILDGGFILVGRETTGSGNIPVDGEITITSKSIIGFGQTAIVVNTTVPIGFSDAQEQKAFVLLFFIAVKLDG